MALPSSRACSNAVKRPAVSLRPHDGAVQAWSRLNCPPRSRALHPEQAPIRQRRRWSGCVARRPGMSDRTSRPWRRYPRDWSRGATGGDNVLPSTSITTGSVGVVGRQAGPTRRLHKERRLRRRQPAGPVCQRSPAAGVAAHEGLGAKILPVAIQVLTAAPYDWA